MNEPTKLRRRGTAALTLAVLTLAACGAGGPAGGAAQGSGVSPPATVSVVSVASATSTVSAGATMSTAASGPLNPAATVTNADLGKTIQVKVGDIVDLDLRAGSGFDNWQVAPPNGAVLMPIVSPAAAAVRGATLCAFRAVGVGQTDITATDRPACAAGQACPQVIQAFKVTIVVVSSP